MIFNRTESHTYNVCERIMRNYNISMNNDSTNDGEEAGYRRGLRDALEFMKLDQLIHEYDLYTRGIQFINNGKWYTF